MSVKFSTYKSQGGTARHVIVNAESDKRELFNRKAFLVAISRQRDTLQVFTDSVERMTRNVEKHDGEKTSALESREEGLWARLSNYLDRLNQSLPEHSRAPKHVGNERGLER